MLWINSYVNKEAILPIHEIRVTPTDGGPLGQDVQAIGRVTEEPGIHIKNRGVVQDEEWLSFCYSG